MPTIQNILITAIIFASCSMSKHSDSYYLQKANEYKRINKYSKAVKCYSKAISINPNDPLYYVYRAESRYIAENGNYNKIYTKQVSDYGKAVDIAGANKAPDSIIVRIYNSKSRFYYDVKEYAIVISIGNYACNDYGSLAHFSQLYKGLAQLQRRDTANAWITLDSAITNAPTNKKYEYLCLRAGTSFNKGYYSDAKKSYLRASAISKLNSQSAGNLAEVYWLENKKDSACYFVRQMDNYGYLNTGIKREIKTYCVGPN